MHRVIGFLNLICQGQIEPAVAFSQEQAVFWSIFFGLVVNHRSSLLWACTLQLSNPLSQMQVNI
jgi:hypothetical protein